MREIARATLACALHRLKTVKVGHRITDSRFASWVCGQGAVVAQLRYGAQAVVFANEYNGRAMYLWGEHDPRITAVMDALLRSGDTMLDIGANFGVTGLFAAQRVGNSGHVHLFEPQPLVAQCLRASLLINGYSSTTVHECALSDHSGVADMAVVDPSNWGMTTLCPTGNGATQHIRVRTEHAGEYIASLGCTNVSLIKIDVEGYEPVILESMRPWLATAQPPAILFECHLGTTDFWRHPTVSILSQLGYSFLSFDLRPFWHTRLCKLDPGRALRVGSDFVAVRWDKFDADRRTRLQLLINS